MNFEVETRHSYKSELTFLSIMTLLFGFCCLFLGYLVLPFAAGFYAALLLVEKKECRVLSYIIPLVLLVVNVLINGFFSLEAIGYVVVGAILFVGFEKRKNKSVTFFLATLALILLMLLSLVFLAFDNLGTFKVSALKEFYMGLYESGKDVFVDFITAFTSVDEEGFVFHNFNAFEAVDMYNAFILSLVPLSIIFALVLVGLSSKLLSVRAEKFYFKDDRVRNWLFVTSPFIAYSYLVITAFASLSTQGIVGVSLSFVSSILMAVYFYVGISFLYKFISSQKSRIFAFTMLFLLVVVFISFSLQIISFVGVFINNAAYKRLNSENVDI